MGTITACNYITCPFNDAGNCSRTAPCIYTNRPKVEEKLFMGSEDFFPLSCLIS